MKSPYYIILVVFVLMLCRCNKLHTGSERDLPQYTYSLRICFKDASGNDLLSTLSEERWQPYEDEISWHGDINPDKLSLECVFSYDINAEIGGSTEYDFRPSIRIQKYDDNYQCTSYFFEKGGYVEGDGIYYLCLETMTPVSLFSQGEKYYFPPQDHITYLISCPIIFGDNSKHTLTTNWQKETNDSIKQTSSVIDEWYFLECKSAEYDGKEVVIKKFIDHSTDYRDYYTYFIDIVLDK